jgi:hypothetical protein
LDENATVPYGLVILFAAGPHDVQALFIFRENEISLGVNGPNLKDLISRCPHIEKDSAGLVKEATPKKTVTINCIKGKTTKKVSGTSPKCPVGFKKK